MHTLSLITVSEKAANAETKAVAEMLIDQCHSLPYIVAECRQGIATEAVARIRLIGKLGAIVCDCLPPAPEAFIDAAMWLCLDKLDYVSLADLVCDHWTAEKVEQREIMDREETEARIAIMEREQQEEECERWDMAY